MSRLEFSEVRAAESILSSIPLDDLVAVFSSRGAGRPLLVYNSVAPSETRGRRFEAILLNDLGEVDLEEYPGLFVGISALDVVRDGLVTKGPMFYPLEQMLVRLGRRRVLHRTLHNLAYYLVDLLKKLSAADPVRRQRVVSKVLQLALPHLLDERGAEGLIAVQPGSDLAAFVGGQVGEWYGVGDYLGDIARDDADGWIVALEEISLFDRQIDPDSHRFVDLRSILRDAGYASALRVTCRALAWRCVEEARVRSGFQGSAWALMGEAWLAQEDAQDLVALLPHADFHHFASKGDALRLYRVLDPHAREQEPGPRWALRDLATREIPAIYQERAFSLIPIKAVASHGWPATKADGLGELLWKAGHETTLAETLSMLARDGLDGAPVASALDLAVLSDLARRGVLLSSLSSPWIWRQGRYKQFVDNTYDILRRALELQGQEGKGRMGDYHRALRNWYGCYNAGSEDVPKFLHQMATLLRAFLRATRLDDDDTHLANARKLLEVEEAALYSPSTAGSGEQETPALDARALPSDLARVRGLLAEEKSEADCLSPVFERVWQQLRGLQDELQDVQTRERNADVQQRKLKELLAHARRHRRLVFAPPHETVVLHTIYDREIANLERLVQELETEARLEIVAINPHVDFQREVDLVFEVRNTSRVEARDVEFVLNRDPSFELLERSSIREFPSLQPWVPERFSYRVRAVQQPRAIFQFTYTYHNLEEQQQVLVQLPVRSLDEAPFEMKGDPYQFGRAIQNPADFYGREDEMKKLLSSLYRGGHTNFLLRGPRRMGKTSMLYMLQHALQDAAIRRRFGIPEHWDASLARYEPVLLDLQAFGFQEGETHIARFFRALLEATCATIAPSLCSKLEAEFSRRWREVDAPRAVLEQLEVAFGQRPEARVVVLLDEYDEIYRPQGRNLDTALRHVVQNEQRLTWIIASTQFLFKESKLYGSPWFNILDIVELDCLSDWAAQRLVEEPSKGERVAWQSDAIVALLDETGCHPAFLQLFCSKIMSFLNREKQNYVLPRTIVALADQIVQEQETIHSHFEFYWADTPGVGQLILLAADESDRPLSRLAIQRWVVLRLTERFGVRIESRVRDAQNAPIPWWEQQFEDGMAWVADVVRAIRFGQSTRTFSFTVPLFHRWLQYKGRYEDLLEAALSKVGTEMERDGLA